MTYEPDTTYERMTAAELYLEDDKLLRELKQAYELQDIEQVIQLMHRQDIVRAWKNIRDGEDLLKSGRRRLEKARRSAEITSDLARRIKALLDTHGAQLSFRNGWSIYLAGLSFTVRDTADKSQLGDDIDDVLPGLRQAEEAFNAAASGDETGTKATA